MNFEFMTIDTPLPLCMPFPRALTGFPVSSTAKVMYCRMLDAKLFIAKPDGSPQRRDRMSANFGQLIRHLEMPHIRFHDLRHTAATNMHQLTGDFYTVGEILGHTLKGIGISLGISTNLEAVTAQYVDVRLERKQSVLQTYHKALQPKTTVTGKEAGQETSKKAKKKSSEMEL